MEDSFQVRVDRAFGSLQPDPPPSSLRSLWCLTDEEIERKEWILDKKDEQHDDGQGQGQHQRLKKSKPYSFASSFLQSILENPQQASTSHQVLESDIQELQNEDSSEEEEEEEEEQKQPSALRRLHKPDDYNNEDWDVRTSVGMDSTLDNEEEEDAYDKVAVGRGESVDRFYMRSLNDYQVEIDSNNELPNSFTDVIRDPRANHMAARQRLKEDDDESARKSVMQFPSVGTTSPTPHHFLQDGVHPKSVLVLSGEENHMATESNKRVGFELVGEGDNMEQIEDLTADGSDTIVPQHSSSIVPDYIQNPSKYTHYTFDSVGDVDEESNQRAYMDLFHSLKGSKSNPMEVEDNDVSTDGPTSSIIFTWKKKPGGSLMNTEDALNKNNMQKKGIPISVAAAAEAQDNEVCPMDNDDLEIVSDRSSSLHKAGGRRYRTKGSANVDEIAY